MAVQKVSLSDIRTDGGTQIRVEIDEGVVADYAAKIVASVELPPAVVFHDGAEHWLADGFHRYHAHRKAGFKTMPCEVREGTRRDAILFACGANAGHGLRRSNADKRKAVETLLKDEEWGKWSDREIAERCAVSNSTVSEYRRSLCDSHSEAPSTRTYVTRYGTTATMNVENIGRNRSEAAVAVVDEAEAEDMSEPRADSGQKARSNRKPNHANEKLRSLAREVRDMAATPPHRFPMVQIKIKAAELWDLVDKMTR